MKRRFAGRPLGDAARGSAIPLVIGHEDCDATLLPGIEQRARALQHFFADTMIGDGRFLHSGAGLTTSLLDGICRSEGTSLAELRAWWQQVTPREIRFVYGPDLARDCDGRWVVLEDNVGCVSGCADGFLLADAYAAVTGLPRPRSDLVAAVEAFLGGGGAGLDDRGVVALLTDAHGARWFDGVRCDEDLRRRQVLTAAGVRVVGNDDLERIASETGAGLNTLTAVVNIGVPSQTTWPMLLEAFFGPSRVPLLNAPGTSVLGSKAFLPFVEAMVRFYLDEEIVLDAPQTILLADGALPAATEHWMIKPAAGCADAGVRDLSTSTREELGRLEAELAGSWPERGAVAQRRVTRSRLPGPGGRSYAVELRAVAYAVGWQDVNIGHQHVARLRSPGAIGAGELLLAPVLFDGGST